MAQATATNANAAFLQNALERNYAMSTFAVTQNGQVLDIELDSVPGWAYAIDLTVQMSVDITVATGGSAPSMSQFAPWNVFSDCQLSLGGGPFQRVSPFFYALRERAMGFGSWRPGYGGVDTFAYASTTEWSIPAINAPANATTTNVWKFTIRIPLQIQHGSIIGHLPLGNSAVRGKLRLTVAPTFYGTDQFMNPLYGGTNVTSAVVSTTGTSYVQPNILYRTTPAIGGQLPTPQIGYVLNVQQRASAFVGAGVLTPIKFQDPFKYLRLWHVVIDGTGAPNSTGITNFELDLTPGYPQFNYANANQLQQYFYQTNRRYAQDMPTGVFVFDLWSGSDPTNPNGNQIIDGSVFSTLQTQIGTGSGFNVSSPAKIVTFAEALSPVQF